MNGRYYSDEFIFHYDYIKELIALAQLKALFLIYLFAAPVCFVFFSSWKKCCDITV